MAILRTLKVALLKTLKSADFMANPANPFPYNFLSLEFSATASEEMK